MGYRGPNQQETAGKGDASSMHRHFGQIVAGVRDYAVFTLDVAGHVTSWNAGAENIKGYEAEEIIGKHFSRFYPSAEIARNWPGEELKIAAGQGRGFLKITRDLSGRIRLASEPLDLESIVTCAIEAAHPLLESKGHSLEIQTPGHHLSARGPATAVSSS